MKQSTLVPLFKKNRNGKMKRIFKLLTLTTAASASLGAYAGFQVSGSQLLDGNGNPFIMRGVNHAHAWYTGTTQQAFTDIASVDANTVRVVLSDGQQWTRTSASEVENIIQWAKDNHLIAVLEIHDVTGSGEQSSAGTLYNATSYWIDIADTMISAEDYVIDNNDKESLGNNMTASKWTDQHIEAIQRINT